MKKITMVLTIVLVLLASVAFSANEEELMSSGFSQKQAKFIMETMMLQLDFVQQTPYEEFAGTDVQKTTLRITTKFVNEHPHIITEALKNSITVCMGVSVEEKSGIPFAVILHYYDNVLQQSATMVFPIHVLKDDYFPAGLTDENAIKALETITAPFAVDTPKYLVRK